MPEVAECLNRRYRALDELINELSALPSHREENLFGKQSYDPGIKLMCDFWNILKENPDYDLSHVVKQRMGVTPSKPSVYRQNVACYMAGNRSYCGPGRGGAGRGGNDPRREIKRIREMCCGTNSFMRDTRDCRITCAPEEAKKPDNTMPLSKALCNLKEAASFDKKCNIRISALMETQKELKAQIQNLEQRERDGIQLLKEADSMWSNMEEEYKNKIALSIERQKVLLKQLKEVEVSHTKWRRNKKELEDELKQVVKSRQEIGEKSNQKNNDIKCIELEIADLTKRISINKRATDGSKQALAKKKAASDKKIANYSEELKKQKAILAEVQKHKKDKEAEGKQYVQEAREDLQNICKVLLQKKIENEDLVAEKEAILQEIDLLKESSNQCKDKCEAKRNHIEDEIKKIDKCIADYKYQCVQCHECTDTHDRRLLCSDCPKCKERRECITAGDHCDRDTSFDCICVVVKEKFLNNVFENMYTVLERQTKTKPGKALADKIVKSLKNSRNGKLNCETRDQVKTFVLNTVKKNLNLTIVGGAVKTRCELDRDSYKQLMCCLQLVKADKPLKEDKGTVAKKEACRRWGATSECNCPGGPAYCACARKAPAPPKEPTPCPDTPNKEKSPADPGAVLCPHKETISCGPECAMIPPPPKSEAIVPTKANKVCSTTGCPFAKNMRTAQCVFGPESTSSLPKTRTASTPIVPGATTVLDKNVSKNRPEKSRKDAKQLKADSNDPTCDCKENSLHASLRRNASLLKNPDLINVSVSSHISRQRQAFFDYGESLEKSYVPNISLKQKEKEENKSVHINQVTQSENLSLSVPITNTDVDLNKMFNDLVEKSTKKSDDTRYVSITDKITETPNQVVQDKLVKTMKNSVSPDSLNTRIGANTSPVPIIHQSILMLSELQQKYENCESVDVKLETETGLYTINSPVTKTISGNLAINVKVLRGKLQLKEKVNPIVIRRSDSGAIILDQKTESFCNAIIRKTATGAVILVVPDSSDGSAIKTTKQIERSPLTSEQYFKVKIESDDFDTTLPLAVLKSTASQNLLLVPDKEFANTYNRKIREILEDETKYFVNLTKTDSRNCVLRVDDSWEDHKPNAVIIKSSSGNIKIVDKNNESVIDNDFQRSSVTSSSKILGEMIGVAPRKMNTESRRLSVFPKKLQKKSNSDANIYEKMKLYSNDKDLLVDPPAILKLTKSGQYAVILGKESKTTFMKNLKTYLKNNRHGLVPIIKNDTGEITISLNDDRKAKNHYGSLKITTSGNMFVIVDKEIINRMDVCDQPESPSLESLNDVASSHIIGKLRRPVHKAVATTCSARPGVECDGSQCACAQLQDDKLDWIYNQNRLINFFKCEVSGSSWKNVTNNVTNETANKYNTKFEKKKKSIESGDSNNNSAPHRIIIKPYGCDIYENPSKSSGSEGDQSQFDDNVWDSLHYLPPQLPKFLTNVKYK